MSLIPAPRRVRTWIWMLMPVLGLWPGCQSSSPPADSVRVGPEIVVENSTVRAGWFRRPAAERTGDPEAERFGTFRKLGLRIVQHPHPEIAARINGELRSAANPKHAARSVKLTDGTPLPDFSEERPADDEAKLTALLTGPEVLSVLVEKSYRPVGAINWTETTEIRHYDLKTGEQVRWDDLVRPADWPVVRAAALAVFTEDTSDALRAELTELTAWPEGYIADGVLHLCVRPIAGSTAGESARFFAVPLGAVRRFLRPDVLAHFGKTAEAKLRCDCGSGG
jgi:hypothetical protein